MCVVNIWQHQINKSIWDLCKNTNPHEIFSRFPHRIVSVPFNRTLLSSHSNLQIASLKCVKKKTHTMPDCVKPKSFTHFEVWHRVKTLCLRGSRRVVVQTNFANNFLPIPKSDQKIITPVEAIFFQTACLQSHTLPSGATGKILVLRTFVKSGGRQPLVSATHNFFFFTPQTLLCQLYDDLMIHLISPCTNFSVPFLALFVRHQRSKIPIRK